MRANAAPPAERWFVLFFWTLVFTLFVAGNVDMDTWWHLRLGELISLHGIPHEELFFFPKLGAPFTPYEWLFQVVSWKIFQLGGFAALFFASAAVVVTTLWIAARACSSGVASRLPLYGILLSLPMYRAYAASARPYLFTYLFFAVFVYVLEKTKSGELPRRTLYVLPAVMMLWVNSHGAYPAGIALMALYAAGEWTERKWGEVSGRRFGPEGLRALCVATGLTALATAANPDGFSLWVKMFEHLSWHGHVAFVSEWQSPSFQEIHFWPFLVYLAAVPALWLYDREKPDATEQFLFYATAFATFHSGRHMPFFLLANLPTLCRHAKAFIRPGPLAVHPAASFAVFVAAVAGSACLLASQFASLDENVRARFPVAAAQAAREKGLDQVRLFNEYNWGGFLVWEGFNIFIGPRAEAHGSDFVNDYLRVHTAREGWEETLERQEVEAILVSKTEPIAAVASRSPRWKEIYRDDLAKIFVRT